MNDKAAIVEYLAERLNGDASECTHMQVPTSWLRVLIDLPEPPQAEELPSEPQPGEPEPEPTPPPAPKRRRKNNQTDSAAS
ncbi:MAG TPA: hypothetical protein DDZ51_05540 [Planctomycetaceae bacterium]|nr:hypothetical protein [Planctomycetaceae bacterium]